MNKKAEMGVGTLIVFIAMLLVAAVAAGVLIQTSTSLQEKALTTGQQAKTQISTNVEVIEVSATDGKDGLLNDFQSIVKLAPGSDPIKLDQVMFTFNTKDATASLKYKPNGVAEKNNLNGYNTWMPEEPNETIGTSVNNYTLDEDLDDDGYNDYIYLNDNLLMINLSTAGLYNVSLGTNLSNISGASASFTVTETEIADATNTYLYVQASGTATVNSTIPADSLIITPYEIGQGYFTAIYEQEGTNFIEGNLQRGDIIRLCYEASGDIGEDYEVRLNFIPKIGSPTMTMFVTPDVISTNRVYLYP